VSWSWRAWIAGSISPGVWQLDRSRMIVAWKVLGNESKALFCYRRGRVWDWSTISLGKWKYALLDVWLHGCDCVAIRKCRVTKRRWNYLTKVDRKAANCWNCEPKDELF
jgi:hypothetical protein